MNLFSLFQPKSTLTKIIWHERPASRKTEMVADYLYRNGIITERAHQEGRSLTRDERNIIYAGRMKAIERNFSIDKINEIEMLGERNWKKVLEKIRVKILFAYYDEPYEDIPARPNYVIRKSNHPSLTEGDHIDASQIESAGQKIPPTPSYEAWVKGGRRVVRK